MFLDSVMSIFKRNKKVEAVAPVPKEENFVLGMYDENQQEVTAAVQIAQGMVVRSWGLGEILEESKLKTFTTVEEAEQFKKKYTAVRYSKHVAQLVGRPEIVKEGYVTTEGLAIIPRAKVVIPLPQDAM